MPRKPVSKTTARLNEDMRRALSAILAEMKDPRLAGGLITVTRVENTSDLNQAKVYVSVLGGVGAAEVVKFLASAKGHVRSEIAARMHIRKAPEMVFIEDDGAAYAEHINKVLSRLT